MKVKTLLRLLSGVVVLLVLALAAADLSAASTAPAKPLNVLFIAADDLRPALGCYGATQVLSPNIDRLAARGLVLNRAYCQYSVCNPSRTSLMTGLRPDSNGVPGLAAHFRRQVPDIVTLPQQFKLHGYVTRAFGKIYHGAWDTAYVGRTHDDVPSWSEPNWFGSPQYYFSPEGMAAAKEVYEKGREWPIYGKADHPELAKRLKSRTALRVRSPAAAEDWKKSFVQALSTEAPDVPDSVPYDGEMTGHAIEALRAMKGRPFFLAVGYTKPHLPFVAPKKYWDLYDRAQLDLPNPATAPKDAPAVATPGWGELRGQYTDIPKRGPLTEAQTRELIHGYYACVSYVDAQVGRLLDELDRLGLRENTIVVLWGDHGWHLGELNHWAKNVNFELANRVPLIVNAPGRKVAGAKSDALVELVDVFPTLCELAGLPLPAHLEGTSFAPLLDAPGQRWKTAAFSQVQFGTVEGRSMRTNRYRFTLWQERKEKGRTVAVELYDFRDDPVERENIAGRTEHAALVKELTAKLEAGWRAAKF